LGSVYALAKAVDEVGKKTRTKMIRSLVAQTGARYRAVSKVIITRSAMGKGEGSYDIIARDVTLSLKEFGPRQTQRGISAAPWGTRRIFPHTFVGPGGHIFVRKFVNGKRADRKPIRKLYGPAIPKEMVKGQTRATFYAEVNAALPAAVEKYLLRQLGGK
jgi:hypothetical protein